MSTGDWIIFGILAGFPWLVALVAWSEQRAEREARARRRRMFALGITVRKERQ